MMILKFTQGHQNVYENVKLNKGYHAQLEDLT